MTPESQVKAISEATGLCPKCDFLNDPKAVDEVDAKLGMLTIKEESPAKRIETHLRALSKWTE
jgi:hypothetical protein